MKRVFGILTIGILTFLACSKSGVREQLPPYDEFRAAMKYYDKGDYLKAQSELQRVIYSYPGQGFIDTAQYHLAMSYFNIESYPEAAGEFKRLLQTYPGSVLADDAQFQLAMSYYNRSPGYSKDQNETYLAIDEFSVFLDRYPTSTFVPDVNEKLNQLYEKLAKKLYKSGELYHKIGDWEPALIYFEQVRDNYPNTEWAILAMYYTGEAQEKLGRKSDALETFRNFIEAFPDHKLTKKAHKHIAGLQPAEVTGG